MADGEMFQQVFKGMDIEFLTKQIGLQGIYARDIFNRIG